MGQGLWRGGERVLISHYGLGTVKTSRIEKYKDGREIRWIQIKLDHPQNGVHEVEVQESRVSLYKEKD